MKFDQVISSPSLPRSAVRVQAALTTARIPTREHGNEKDRAMFPERSVLSLPRSSVGVQTAPITARIPTRERGNEQRS